MKYLNKLKDEELGDLSQALGFGVSNKYGDIMNIIRENSKIKFNFYVIDYSLESPEILSEKSMAVSDYKIVKWQWSETEQKNETIKSAMKLFKGKFYEFMVSKFGDDYIKDCSAYLEKEKQYKLKQKTYEIEHEYEEELKLLK